MCGWNPFRDVVESIASLAGNYFLPGSSLLTDHLVSKGAQSDLSSPIGELLQVGSGAAGGGAFGAGLQSAGGALEQSGLSSLEGALGNGATNAGNGLGSLFGDPTLGSDIGTGASNLGNNLSNNLSQFTQNSGLSSLFGGTPQPTSDFTSAWNGIYGSPGSADLAGAAATPSATGGLTGALPSSGTIGAAGGGGAGAGFDLSGAGDTGFLPSSTGIGGNLDTSSLASNTLNPGGIINGVQTDASNAAAFNPSLYSTPASAQIPGAQVGSGLGNQLSIPGVSGSSGTSSIFASPSAAVDTNLAGGTSAPILDTSAINSYGPSSGGNNMGILSSLFGGGSSGATPSAGTNITNSLLRGGLGYLFNQPNTAGANAINGATQQAQSNFAPFLAAGTGAENTLSNLYGTNGAGAQASAQQNFQNTPGYQFALNQGINAVDANAAAMGNPISGNTQQAVNNYAQGTANQTYNNYINQLQNLASGGMSAAGGSGTAGLAGASAISQLGQNKANAANTAIGTGLSGLFPGGGINLQALLGNGGSGNQGGLLSLFG